MDMKCEGCVNSVKNKLETVNGRFSEAFFVLFASLFRDLSSSFPYSFILLLLFF